MLSRSMYIGEHSIISSFLIVEYYSSAKTFIILNVEIVIYLISLTKQIEAKINLKNSLPQNKLCENKDISQIEEIFASQ